MSHRSSVDAMPSAPFPPTNASLPADPPRERGGHDAAPDVSCFHVVAEAHPGTVGRLLQVIAKRGLVPSYLHSVLSGRRGDELAVDLQVGGLDDAARALVAAQLRALVAVRTVLTSVKSFVD